MLDLSYFEARAYLDERVANDDKRRDDLSLAINAPFAFVGLGVGGAIAYWFTVVTGVLAVYVLILPFIVAGLFVVIPAPLVKRLFKPKQRSIDLTLEETEVLQQIDDQRRRQGVRPFASDDPNAIY